MINNQKMRNWRHPSVLLLCYCLLAGGGILSVLPAALGTPSEPENSFYLGYSIERILLAALILLLAFTLIGIAIRAGANRSWAESLWAKITGSRKIVRAIILGSVLCFTVGWIASFLPAYRVSEAYTGYFVRLHPFVIWITLVSSMTLAIMSVNYFGWHWEAFASDITANRQKLRVGMIMLMLLLLILLLVYWTGIGVRVREDYWYPAGVPILGLQLLLAFAIGGILIVRERRLKLNARQSIHLDLVICAVLWILTAIIWAKEPLHTSFFLPGPSLPNNEFYPYSDAATFDLHSQFALIGQGLVNGGPFDRALYPGFLFYLHALAGQNFERLMSIQAALYAVFPAILYLLGKQLHSRAAGVSAGLVSMLRGINAIAGSTWIDSAGPKMSLTDFPAALCIALIALLVIQWMRDPAKNRKYALWAGGAVGAGIMLRSNTLFLVPFILLYALSAFPRQSRKWMLACALLILAMVTTTLPWDLRNQAKGSPMFSLYFERLQMLIRTRYSSTPSHSSPPDGNAAAHAAYLRVGYLSEIKATNDLESLPIDREPGAGPCGSSMACSIANNYFHNLVTAVLILPTSPELHDLRHTIKDESSYWQQDWTGQDFGLPAGLFLIINLALIALGIGAAWGRLRSPALVPGVILIAYAASNALARTSGGRYIVPMEWIVCLYFVLGAIEVIQLTGILLGVKPGYEQPNRSDITPSVPLTFRGSLVQTVFILLILCITGSLIPASEWIYPRRYRAEDAGQILAGLDESELLRQAGIESDALRTFASSPQAQVLMGRALYPRYYLIGQGESPNDYPYSMLDFPRLVFTLIGPAGQTGVILPGDLPAYFPNGGDVIVVGCQSENYTDALLVYLPGDPGTLYTRSPGSPLECPLEQPICEDNRSCE